MNAFNHPLRTGADLLATLQQAAIPAERRRDLISALNRIAAMSGCDPAALVLDVPTLRARIGSIRPAAHGVSAKTFSNLRSLFVSALEWGGIIDSMGRGEAKRTRTGLRWPKPSSTISAWRMAWQPL